MTSITLPKKLGYLKAIRKKCLDCAEDMAEVKDCKMTDCAIYPFRMGRGIVGKSRLKAIRQKCLWCMAGKQSEIKLCQSPKCALFLHRGRKTGLVPPQEWPEIS